MFDACEWKRVLPPTVAFINYPCIVMCSSGLIYSQNQLVVLIGSFPLEYISARVVELFCVFILKFILVSRCWRQDGFSPLTPQWALDAQKVANQPTCNKKRSMIDTTDLEIDIGDVELILGWKSSQSTSRKIHQEEACGRSSRTSKVA